MGTYRAAYKALLSAVTAHASRQGTKTGQSRFGTWVPTGNSFRCRPASSCRNTSALDARVGAFSPDGTRLFTTFNYGADPANSNSEVEVLDAVTGRDVLTIPVALYDFKFRSQP